MALVKWKKRDLYDPWANLRSLQSDINDLFEFDRFPSATGIFDRRFSPAIDVIDGEKEYQVVCELPGIDQKNIEVSIASNVLTLKGEKHENKEDKGRHFFKKEAWSGSVQRTIPLSGPVDADKVKAEMADGMLTITVPKKEESIPKQISVKV